MSLLLLNIEYAVYLLGLMYWYYWRERLKNAIELPREVRLAIHVCSQSVNYDAWLRSQPHTAQSHTSFLMFCIKSEVKR